MCIRRKTGQGVRHEGRCSGSVPRVFRGCSGSVPRGVGTVSVQVNRPFTPGVPGVPSSYGRTTHRGGQVVTCPLPLRIRDVHTLTYKYLFPYPEHPEHPEHACSDLRRRGVPGVGTPPEQVGTPRNRWGCGRVNPGCPTVAVMSESATLADVERLCWHLSGWQVEQRDVDQLLAVVQAYGSGGGSAAAPQLAGGGLEGAEPPAEDLRAPSASEEAPTPLAGPQAPVQRVEVTGTLTLKCSGACGRSRRAARKAAGRPLRVPSPPAIAIPETVRTCRACGRTQPIDVYGRDAHGLRGRRSCCQDCENARKRDMRRDKSRTAA